MPIDPDRQLIRGWLARLSLAIPAAAEIADIAARIDQITDLLVAKVPPSLFTTDCMEFCLRRFKFFPSYADLWGRLQTYQREHQSKPVFQALPGFETEAPKDAPIPKADRPHVDSWLRALAGGQVADSDLALRLSVVRRYAETGFGWLVRNNATAGAIAARRGWVAEEARDPTDFTDPKRILASVRNILIPMHPQADQWLRALRAAVERAAPHLVELVPATAADTIAGQEATAGARKPTAAQAADIRADEGVVRVEPAAASVESASPLEQAAARFEASHGRKPGQLSAAQMHEMRMANPILRPIAEREARIAAERKLAAEAFANRPPDFPDEMPERIYEDDDMAVAGTDEHGPELDFPGGRSGLPPLSWGEGADEDENGSEAALPPLVWP